MCNAVLELECVEWVVTVIAQDKGIDLKGWALGNPGHDAAVLNAAPCGDACLHQAAAPSSLIKPVPSGGRYPA